ncbi:MAG: hypothetical protein IPL46_19760 [Saprospiraceae bacterium]|nr:hypothetical protein [Saprospiraceae bacterium]
MRTLLKVCIPVERGNSAIRDGSLGKIIERIMSKIQPEGSYFTTSEGKRTGLFFFDLKDVTQIPEIVEPFFMELKAEVDFRPVMNTQSFKKGLAAAMSKA